MSEGALTPFMPETFMASFMQQLNDAVKAGGLTDEVPESWEMKQFHAGFLVSSPVHGVSFYVEAGEGNTVVQHDVEQLAMFIGGCC